MGLPNILLCTIDALRFDAAPKMAALQNDGWCFFGNHYSVAHCSDPNYLALMTGWSPDAIKEFYDVEVYTQMGTEFTRPFLTIQYMLKKLLNYRCWAFEPVLVPKFYHYGFDEILWFKAEDTSDVNTPGIRQVLNSWGKDRPWFGFVRTMDCHYPYLGATDIPRNKLGQVDNKKVHGDYWKAVDHTNEFLGTFLGWLLEEFPNTLVFVLSDHGESLGEHGLWDHLFTLYEALVHVPLWVYCPGGKGGRICAGLTQHTDIVPTICDALGIDVQGEGQSWLPWLAGGGSEPDRDFLFLEGWGCHPVGKPEDTEGKTAREMWKHRAIRGKPWKYVVNWHQEKGAGFELFNLDGDPMEEKDLSNRHPEIAKAYSDLLHKRAPHFPQFKAQVIMPAYTRQEANEIMARLISLGYA